MEETKESFETKMLLGGAVMLFHKKIRHSKKYRALTDADPLVNLCLGILCIKNRFLLLITEDIQFRNQ